MISPSLPSASFHTTHWSVVQAAGRDYNANVRRAALSDLCQAYWRPVYHLVRRYESNAERAQDLTQSFFVRLLERDLVAQASPERGRFRSFLLASVKNFLANERDRDRTLKRGGGVRAWSLDWAGAESSLALEPADYWTPERLFDRAWALTLLNCVMDRLRDEFAAAGKARQFDLLKDTLAGGGDYGQIAAELKISEAATRQAATRLRKRFGEQLRREVAQTVAEDGEVDEEIRSLFDVLGS